MIIDEIQKHREAMGFTVNKLATSSGVASSTLDRIIKGETQPQAVFEKIASALGCEWKLVPKKKTKQSP